MSGGGGSKPKQSYADKVNAAVAVAEDRRFVEKFYPKLLELKDKTSQQDLAGYAAGRGAADVAQGVGTPTMAQAASTTRGGDLAKLASGVETKARATGEAAKQDRLADVLASARGQAQTAQSGLATAARIGSAAEINKFRAQQIENKAFMDAAGFIGGSYMLKGLENYRQEKLDKETAPPSNPAPEPSLGRSFSPRTVVPILDRFFTRG
jgi:hypothetical protein